MVDIPSDVSDAGSTRSSPNKSEPQLKVSVHNVPLDERPDVMFTPRRASRKERDDDEEEEDLDALIEELESLDPDAELEAEIETVAAAGNVPEELLQTDTRVGLIEPEVVTRRKKYGLNQMKEEKENLLLKFLGYFVGPIQFVMEVWMHAITTLRNACTDILSYRLLQSLPPASRIGLTSASSVVCSYSTLVLDSSRSFKLHPRLKSSRRPWLSRPLCFEKVA